MVVSCPARGDQRCDALITTHRTRLHKAEQLSHDRSFSLGLRLTEALVYVRQVHHERSQRIGTALMSAGIEGGRGGRVARAPRRPSLYDEAFSTCKVTTTPSVLQRVSLLHVRAGCGLLNARVRTSKSTTAGTYKQAVLLPARYCTRRNGKATTQIRRPRPQYACCRTHCRLHKPSVMQGVLTNKRVDYYELTVYIQDCADCSGIMFPPGGQSKTRSLACKC